MFLPPLPGLYIIVGPTGSGKSEFAVNLALSFAARGAKAALADLDVVNPYFRSREQMGVLERAGVRVVAPEGELRDTDLPNIPAQTRALIIDKTLAAILDAGGGRAGARALASFGPEIARRGAVVYYVLNSARRDNATSEAAAASIREVEAACGLAVTGIVHNTHLLHLTTPQDVLEGAEMAARVSRLTGFPVVCHAAVSRLLPELSPLTPLFPLRAFLGRPWEESTTQGEP